MPRCRIDDALDVSSVHGVTGIIGSIAIGFCAQKSLNPDGARMLSVCSNVSSLTHLARCGPTVTVH
jgi:ammonia channel protein AmtB